MTKTRRWNLNVREGRLAATGLTDTTVDLRLGIKRSDGAKEPVGRFLLDLEALAERGFVTKRGTGAGAVFDVQIYRDSDGRFLLGVRQGRTTPLDRFAQPLDK